ncbi:MAG: hypothetical protein U0T82_01530 [Bacteroidales bacterium]
MKSLFVASILLLSPFMASTQELALEIYSVKKPAKSYQIKEDDKVLIKCRHLKNGYQKMVVARVAVIDSNKFYFYPLNKNYRESIYTLSTLNEIGIKTGLRRATFLVLWAREIYYFSKGDIKNTAELRSVQFKMVNVKSRKWDVRLISQ